MDKWTGTAAKDMADGWLCKGLQPAKEDSRFFHLRSAEPGPSYSSVPFIH